MAAVIIFPSVVALFDSELLCRSLWLSLFLARTQHPQEEHVVLLLLAAYVQEVGGCGERGMELQHRERERVQERDALYDVDVYVHVYVCILAPWLFCIFPASARVLLLLLLLLLLLHSNFTHWIPEMLSYSRLMIYRLQRQLKGL